MTGPRVDSMMLCGTLGPPAYHIKHLSCVGPKAYMGDIDIKDMMHPELCSVIGVDLIPYFPKELHPKMEVHHLREHWPHCGNGFKNSPYIAIQVVLFVKDIIRGDPRGRSNVF